MNKKDWIHIAVVIFSLTALGTFFYFSEGNFKGLTPDQKLTPSTQGACYVGGCSSQVCSDTEGMASNCEYKEQYACYQKTSKCERQSSGECGWTPTTELAICIAGVNNTEGVVMSPEGNPVEVSFTPCDSVDVTTCFGSGARPLGKVGNVLLWDLITTSNQLLFGLESEVGTSPHYVVRIDMKGGGYTSTDYEYFKNKVPSLFSERMSGSQ